MIILIHHKKTNLNKAYHNDQELLLKSDNAFEQLIEIALKFPDQWIGWTSKKRNVQEWEELKQKAFLKYTIVSKGESPSFLHKGIDYVDDTPFVNFKTNQWYPTWIMSSEIGIINASLLQFPISWKLSGDFEYDLNVFTKLIQDQGVLCYSNLSKSKNEGSSNLIYSFIAQTKKKGWVLFLLFCHLIYEKRFPFLAYLKACFKGIIDFKIDLRTFQEPLKVDQTELLYDVVIPTMGRASYLKDVLKDLSIQNILPQKVIIVEQNEDLKTLSELDYLNNEIWPFEIIHHYIHQTGACNARNLAIKHTSSPWILLFDDDIRIKPDFINNIYNTICATQVKALTFSCLQSHEIEKQKTYMQWPYFGSGCSMIHREVMSKCDFDMALEHGYGEDVDYGMQIRNAGYDIIYVPQIQILHLKAPMGGFRNPHIFPWHEDEIQPKPSPQIMYYRKKNYTPKQLLGYKAVLFFKFYKDSGIKNPISYFRYYKKAWASSLNYATQLK